MVNLNALGTSYGKGRRKKGRREAVTAARLRIVRRVSAPATPPSLAPLSPPPSLQEVALAVRQGLRSEVFARKDIEAETVADEVARKLSAA